MRIIFAADHAGYELKNTLLAFVDSLGYDTKDCGAHQLHEDDDYPEIIRTAVTTMRSEDRAIILGGSGQGEAMVANKIPGIRAAVWYGGNKDIIVRSREHNDANVLSIGARFVTVEEAKDAVQTWLTTEFSGEVRHVRRIHKIDRPLMD